MRVARCTAVMLVLVALVSSVPCVLAPKVSFWTAESGAGSSGVLPTVAPAAAAIVGTAAAVGVVYRGKQSFFTSAGGIAPSAGGNTTAPADGAAAGTSATWGRGQQTAFRVPPAWTASEEATSNMCEDASSDDSDDSDEPSGDECVPSTTSAAQVKLWTNAQFPEGMTPLANNWDMANLSAAQDWTCPCSDRRNCIGAERGLTVLQLYEHRKGFLTTCNSTGGKRDSFVSEIRGHYQHWHTRSFSRSFVVGPLNDCCVASVGLAKGLSFQTFANARADVRNNRTATTKVDRKRKRGEKVSGERSIIDAYIRRSARYL